MTVRNPVRTYRIVLDDVVSFADGSQRAGEAGHLWVLRIVPRDARHRSGSDFVG